MIMITIITTLIVTITMIILIMAITSNRNNHKPYLRAPLKRVATKRPGIPYKKPILSMTK